jgi:hypothetical protein
MFGGFIKEVLRVAGATPLIVAEFLVLFFVILIVPHIWES